MMFGESGDLFTYLKTRSGITDLVGAGDAARIYWGKPRQAKAVPYLVLTIGDGESARHLGGLSGIRLSTVHVYCYAALPSTTETLAEAVRLSFGQGLQRQTIGGTFINWCNADLIDDGTDPVQEGSDVTRWWRRVLLEIQHSEAKA